MNGELKDGRNGNGNSAGWKYLRNCGGRFS